MERKLKFFYDKEGDVLDIAIDDPTESISKELENDIIKRLDPHTDEIVGFTILNYEERFEHLDSSETLPIASTFSHISKALEAKG